MPFRPFSLALALVTIPALAMAAPMGDDAAAALARGLPTLLLFALALGAGTALTPCVLPMIPITLAVFGARKDVPRVRALSLSVTYVAGIVTLFGILGAIISLLGKVTHVGGLLGNPWFVGPLATFFLLMAASMFGAFDLSLPGALQERLARVGGAGYGGAYAMGLVAGLIASPCVAAPLLSLLALTATRQDPLQGFVVMGTYGLGLGWPFVVLAAFALSLPKSGPWMEAVKSLLGLVMVVVALYYLRGIIPPLHTFASPRVWFLASAIALVVAGLALGALHLDFHGAGLSTALRKAAGLVLCSLGAYAILAFTLTPRPVNLVWASNEAAGLAQARAQRRPLVVDFTATWCLPCQEMRVHTFTAPEVAKELRRFVLVEIDVTKDDDAADQAKARHGAHTLPAIVLYDSRGARVTNVGKALSPSEFLVHLRAVR
jgi:thiol:disulfide interchange protein DsbD